uniref:Uncharacterized protein n=1 Tax=Avena sativa TaxID=4498 RepID=A0ACD5ZIV2_AVESA
MNKNLDQATLLTLWRSWHIRNDIYHGKGDASIEHSARYLLSYAATLNTIFMDAMVCNLIDKKGKKPIGLEIFLANRKDEKEAATYWEPPLPGWLKVNVDGSYVAANNNGATCMVIRNDKGKTIVAAGSVLNNCSSAEEAEALALLHGARLAKDWAKQPIIFESDCASIVKVVQNGGDTLSYLRSILHDFRNCILNHQNWKCVLAKRVQNYAAHECAACVRCLGVECVWSYAFPEQINKALALDCNRMHHLSE